MTELLDAMRPSEPGKANYLMAVSNWCLEIGKDYDELRALVLRLQEERDMWHRDGSEEYRQRMEMKKQRDALLEALQVITEQARDGWRDTESSPAYHFERIQDKALDAMANVEGKDGQGER